MNGARGILLCDAGYYGTLAAARTLGREGVPVTVIDADLTAPALWSRHVARRLRCPPVADLERFVEWLLDFGRREPGYVIYPTSDELCFALALHKDELLEYFALYQPDFSVIERILDKGRLAMDARAVGLDVPDTWLPENDADVERVAREAYGPIMIKPRTQILLTTHAKGAMGPVDPGGLRDEYARFMRFNTYGPVVRRTLPDAMRPMLQRFYPEAIDGVHSLTGFRDRLGRHFVTLGAKKILQRPRSMGVGLCFEGAPVDPELARKSKLLLERVGYYGVFELEFILAEGRSLLIDFNPRFYNQVGLDVARGLPLPQLAWAAALGNDDEVARLAEHTPAGLAPDAHAFCNAFSFEVMLGAQWVIGSMSTGEVARWRRWRVDHRATLVDAVADPEDRRPQIAEITKQLLDYVRNPRLFWRAHRPRREATNRTE